MLVCSKFRRNRRRRKPGIAYYCLDEVQSLFVEYDEDTFPTIEQLWCAVALDWPGNVRFDVLQRLCRVMLTFRDN